jgi:catechol 2,3-dioxygenase-like lactoylglutathione lyase family enzyme
LGRVTVPEITCFHIAVVVNSIETAIEAYRRFLGNGPWHIRDMSSGARIAYGSAGGQTWELIEVRGAGGSQFHQFHAEHGEGVQHIGFWTPDIRASVEDSLARGARLVSATRDAQGNTAVQLLPRADVPAAQLETLGMGAFMDLGFGGWRLEYIGKTAGEKFFEDWLGQDYERIILVRAHAPGGGL